MIVYIQLVKKERTHNISIHNQWDKVLLWTVMKLFAAAEYRGVDCLARGRENVDIECIMDELSVISAAIINLLPGDSLMWHVVDCGVCMVRNGSEVV